MGKTHKLLNDAAVTCVYGCAHAHVCTSIMLCIPLMWLVCILIVFLRLSGNFVKVALAQRRFHTIKILHIDLVGWPHQACASLPSSIHTMYTAYAEITRLKWV